MEGIVLNISVLEPLSQEQLYQLCLINRHTHIERNPEGELIIMAPAGGETGRTNFQLSGQVFMWNEHYKLGVAFDSSAGFTLPDGSMRAADVAWVSNERWQALTQAEREMFPPLCPDFIIELMSLSDRLAPAQKKMKEWMANGCRLGWLIDRKNEHVYLYRANSAVEMISSFETVISGEDVLPHFQLNLRELR